MVHEVESRDWIQTFRSATGTALARVHPPGPRVTISFAMYCTHCGHIGKPKRITKGTMGTELLLLLLGILPGILYGVWRLTSRYEGCPRCLAPHMIPEDSPRAQQRLG